MEKIIKFITDYKDIFSSIGSIAQVLVAYYAFRLAQKVHQEFAKNHTKAKQVEVMCKLVEKLNSSKIKITFWYFSDIGGVGEGSGVFYNVFELGNLLNTNIINKIDNQTVDFKEYDAEPIIFEHNSNQLLDIKKIIDNPFLPKSIADGLMNFYFSSHKVIDRQSLADKEVVIVRTSIFQDNQSITKENVSVNTYLKGEIFINHGFAFVSWLNLKTYAKNLTMDIDSWFKEHGIKDVNLRIDDYKNPN